MRPSESGGVEHSSTDDSDSDTYDGGLQKRRARRHRSRESMGNMAKMSARHPALAHSMSSAVRAHGVGHSREDRSVGSDYNIAGLQSKNRAGASMGSLSTLHNMKQIEAASLSGAGQPIDSGNEEDDSLEGQIMKLHRRRQEIKRSNKMKQVMDIRKKRFETLQSKLERSNGDAADSRSVDDSGNSSRGSSETNPGKFKNATSRSTGSTVSLKGQLSSRTRLGLSKPGRGKEDVGRLASIRSNGDTEDDAGGLATRNSSSQSHSSVPDSRSYDGHSLFESSKSGRSESEANFTNSRNAWPSTEYSGPGRDSVEIKSNKGAPSPAVRRIQLGMRVGEDDSDDSSSAESKVGLFDMQNPLMSQHSLLREAKNAADQADKLGEPELQRLATMRPPSLSVTASPAPKALTRMNSMSDISSSVHSRKSSSVVSGGWIASLPQETAKVKLAALFVGEALAGRDYWLGDLQENVPTGISEMTRPQTALYLAWHSTAWRASTNAIILLFCALSLWEAPYKTLVSSTNISQSSYFLNGCPPSDSHPGWVVAVMWLCIVLLLLDAAVIVYFLGIQKLRRMGWVQVHLGTLAMLVVHCCLTTMMPAYRPHAYIGALRPLLILTSSRSMRLLTQSFFHTAKALGNFGALVAVFLLIYGILGVQVAQVVKTQNCSPGQLEATVRTNGGSLEAEAEIINSCEMLTKRTQFRSLPYSVLSMFVLLTTENFPDIMLPMMTLNAWTINFFVTFITIGVWVIMSVLLAVMFDGFKDSKLKQLSHSRLTERLYLLHAFHLVTGNSRSGSSEEMSFAQFDQLLDEVPMIHANKYQKKLLFEFLDEDSGGSIDVFEFFQVPDVLRLDLRKKSSHVQMTGGCLKGNSFGKWLVTTVESKWFELLVMLVIVLLLFVMALQATLIDQDGNLSAQEEKVFFGIDLAILVFFIIEISMRMMAYGMNFFRSVSNMWDMVLVLVTAVPDVIALSQSGQGDSALNPALLRITRILRLPRLLRLFSVSKNLRVLTTTFVRAFKSLVSLAIYVGVLVFMSTQISMLMFNCAYNPANLRISYRNMMAAGMANFQILTTSNWHEIMYDVMDATNDWAAVWFVLFVIVMDYFMFNIVIALIIEAFQMETTYASTVVEEPSKDVISTFNASSSFMIHRVGASEYSREDGSVDGGDLSPISMSTPPNSKTPRSHYDDTKVYNVRMKRRFSRELVREQSEALEKRELKTISDTLQLKVDLFDLKKQKEDDRGGRPTFMGMASGASGMTVVTKADKFAQSKSRDRRNTGWALLKTTPLRRPSIASTEVSPVASEQEKLRGLMNSIRQKNVKKSMISSIEQAMAQSRQQTSMDQDGACSPRELEDVESKLNSPSTEHPGLQSGESLPASPPSNWQDQTPPLPAGSPPPTTDLSTVRHNPALNAFARRFKQRRASVIASKDGNESLKPAGNQNAPGAPANDEGRQVGLGARRKHARGARLAVT